MLATAARTGSTGSSHPKSSRSFHRTVFLAGLIAEPAHDEPRWLLLGETNVRRRLALIFTRRGNQLRPISCRRCGATKGGSMTTRKRGSKAAQKKAGKRDLQVEEFASRDLGEDIRAAGGLRPIRKTLPTSIVLEQDLIDKLRKKAAKRGLGYQTMLKVIVREHVDEY
jgi:hypothetical protein